MPRYRWRACNVSLGGYRVEDDCSWHPSKGRDGSKLFCQIVDRDLVQGGKVYGVHVGPFPTPAREYVPRVGVENFNYDQEELLRERSREARWSLTKPLQR